MSLAAKFIIRTTYIADMNLGLSVTESEIPKVIFSQRMNRTNANCFKILKKKNLAQNCLLNKTCETNFNINNEPIKAVNEKIIRNHSNTTNAEKSKGCDERGSLKCRRSFLTFRKQGEFRSPLHECEIYVIRGCRSTHRFAFNLNTEKYWLNAGKITTQTGK